MLCAFGAVLMSALVVFNVLNRSLAEYERRYLQESSQTLTEMFIFVDERQVLTLTLISAVVLGLLGLLIANWLVGLLLFGLGFMLPFSVVKRLREQRLQRFDRQLVDALVQMSAALRAGLTLGQATEGVSQEMPNPLAQEFGLFLKEVKLGVSQEEAFIHMAERVRSENLLLVVTATNVSRKLGGNLAEMYDTISTTIRERFETEGRVRALTSMGRMQGWVVGLMPLFIGIAFYFMRPDLVGPMMNSRFGLGLVVSIIVMETVGMFLIRRIVAIDV